MDKSLVLIADIERSKETQDEQRDKLQEVLSSILKEINAENPTILSPYTITLGDEFQAVYDSAEGIWSDVLKIWAAIHPQKIRFSLGVGSIDTSINKEQAIGMDGPAFHVSREGMETLKESGFLFHLSIEGEESAMLNFINNSLNVISRQMRGWKKNRLRILCMLKEGYDYKAITDELDISEAAFYKNKKAGLLDEIVELSDNLTKIINQKLGA